jgi:hypothetical protein
MLCTLHVSLANSEFSEGGLQFGTNTETNANRLSASVVCQFSNKLEVISTTQSSFKAMKFRVKSIFKIIRKFRWLTTS